MASSNRLMTSADVARLPLHRIQAALRETTEVLAAELAAPTDTTPDWTDFEWCIARAVAAIHGISPLLSRALRWRGPESWQCFLNEQREHTFQRHRRIAELIADIDTRATREGLAAVALKGVALHQIGLYQPGERPMSDIDLLVKSTDMQATARLLGSCGFHASYSTWKHWVFEPDAATDPVGFGEHAGNAIKIEVHTKVAERMPIVDRDVSALIFPSHPQAGLNPYPSIAALMTHLLLHAAGTLCFNGVRLLHLHDIALLSRRMTDRDWEEVFTAGGKRACWWLSPPLTLTSRYYPTAIPTHVVARAQSECSSLLRRIVQRQRLSDVSLSNLRIRAFPGLEWSHSLHEMYRCVLSRLRPDAETLGWRKVVTRTNPGLASFSWSGLPQWQRMILWVVRRPPRLETLSSVSAALANLTQPS